MAETRLCQGRTVLTQPGTAYTAAQASMRRRKGSKSKHAKDQAVLAQLKTAERIDLSGSTLSAIFYISQIPANEVDGDQAT
ncbi:hypothetical protein C1752_03636 [Acaryochloris thomasi RCC1774]|uniref:Uncharacterized protein n=1 Tax=Acaryochloris thomasi RCC1774 TaxID=1764569 RepID=A0A2W1JFP2_9CYAN|nr:hypothetical protein [Acaryochloris thomasi]PZD72523.1 hypothetical protein C1752_03636 [Acaryochloris thomasi RCC1774]